MCYGQTLPNRPSLIFVCIHLHQYLLCGYLIKLYGCHIVHLRISNSLVFFNPNRLAGCIIMVLGRRMYQAPKSLTRPKKKKELISFFIKNCTRCSCLLGLYFLKGNKESAGSTCVNRI